MKEGREQSAECVYYQTKQGDLTDYGIVEEHWVQTVHQSLRNQLCLSFALCLLGYSDGDEKLDHHQHQVQLNRKQPDPFVARFLRDGLEPVWKDYVQ